VSVATTQRINAAIAIWRERHSAELNALGSSQAASDYAYGVMQHRLGIRASLPGGGVIIGRDDKGNRKLIRGQVDAILAELGPVEEYDTVPAREARGTAEVVSIVPEPLRLYGLGRRGIAVHPPDHDVEAEGAIPVYLTAEEVQAVIDARTARYGLGNLHVIEYVLVVPRD
jgi:hypothetical protein